MTTFQRRELDRQQARLETRDSYAQAQREAQTLETGLEMWSFLFLNGEYRRAAQQWREIIHPTLTQQH